MREILAASISAIIKNIGLIASAEHDSEKREILVRRLAEDAIEGINEFKTYMRGYIYEGEAAEIDTTVAILRKTYSNNINKEK